MGRSWVDWRVDERIWGRRVTLWSVVALRRLWRWRRRWCRNAKALRRLVEAFELTVVERALMASCTRWEDFASERWIGSEPGMVVGFLVR